MRKRIILIFAVFLMIVLLTGCKTKKPIDIKIEPQNVYKYQSAIDTYVGESIDLASTLENILNENNILDKRYEQLKVTIDDNQEGIIVNNYYTSNNYGQSIISYTDENIEITLTINIKKPTKLENVSYYIDEIKDETSINKIVNYQLSEVSLKESSEESVVSIADGKIKINKAGVSTLLFTGKNSNGKTEAFEIQITILEPIQLDEKVYNYDDVKSITQIIELVDYSFDNLSNIESSNSEIISINEDLSFSIIGAGAVELLLTDNNGKYKIAILINPNLIVLGVTEMKRGAVQNLSISFSPSSAQDTYEIICENEEVVKNTSGRMIKAIAPGETTVKVITSKGIVASLNISVIEVYYQMQYDLTDEIQALMPNEYPTSYTVDDLPVALPLLEREGYVFQGWLINGSSTYKPSDLVLEITSTYKTIVKLRPIFAKARLEIRYENNSLIDIDESINLIATSINIPSNIDKNDIVWESKNPDIAVVDNKGVVTGIAKGSAEIFAYLKGLPDINMSIGVNVGKDETMNELLEYLISNSISEIKTKYITAFAYQGNYTYLMQSGVSYYLFEKLNVTEKMTPIGAANRPGDVYEKHYVTVHDTASGAETATASAHARYVVEQGGGGTSWHYSVGNDGIYHQIPDNERAFHAGDGRRPYELFDSGVTGVNKYPVVTISTDGYYELDGVKSLIEAPKNGTKILTTKDINDMGIRVVLENGKYYIGITYFNTDYNKIANGGGNCNSIGIEMCINKGSDIFYTWQINAKLVAKLLVENKLTIDDVKPHHFFSGKDCPATMLNADMWETFIKMVEVEYTILTKYADYTITFTSNDPNYLNNNGKIYSIDTYSKCVSYTITVSKNNISNSVTLSTILPGKLSLIK